MELFEVVLGSLGELLMLKFVDFLGFGDMRVLVATSQSFLTMYIFFLNISNDCLLVVQFSCLFVDVCCELVCFERSKTRVMHIRQCIYCYRYRLKHVLWYSCQ